MFVLVNTELSGNMAVRPDQVHDASWCQITARLLVWIMCYCWPWVLLAFTGFIVDAVTSVLLVPGIKDEAAKVNTMDN